MRLADTDYANLLCKIFLLFKSSYVIIGRRTKPAAQFSVLLSCTFEHSASLGIIFVYFSAASHACCDTTRVLAHGGERVQVAP